MKYKDLVKKVEELERRINEQEKLKNQFMIRLSINEPKWTFSEDEKVILRNIQEEFRWIVRDRDCGLNVYKVKPYKLDNCWGRKNLIDFEVFTVFEHLFQSIKWEDEEPCEFRKYI